MVVIFSHDSTELLSHTNIKQRVYIFIILSLNIGPVPTKDMQTPLSFHPIFMEDAQYTESNEKSIFQIIFFELLRKFLENWQLTIQK